MHSNFITPPDFVEENLHTVTVVDASHEDIELLVKMCEHGDDAFNIYLYKSAMGDPNWLQTAVEKSHAVIVNAENKDNHWLCGHDKTYYYGPTKFLAPAQYINNPLHYFVLMKETE